MFFKYHKGVLKVYEYWLATALKKARIILASWFVTFNKITLNRDG